MNLCIQVTWHNLPFSLRAAGATTGDQAAAGAGAGAGTEAGRLQACVSVNGNGKHSNSKSPAEPAESIFVRN